MQKARSARLEPLSEGTKPALSRRQLIQAGVWAAPVLVLATAAPAAAASQAPTAPSIPWEFASSTVSWLYGSNQYPAGVTSTASVRVSAAAQASLGGITLNAVYQTSQIGSTPPNPTSLSGTGWSFVSKSVGASTVTYSFLYAPTVAVGATTNTLSYQLVVGSSMVSQPIVEVTNVANAADATPTTISQRAVTQATASGISFWYFNEGTTGGSNRQSTYLNMQMQVGVNYSQLWPVTQMPVTFIAEASFPAAYVADAAPTISSNNNWKYVDRRVEGSNIIFRFAFVKADRTTPRPLQATNANGVAQVADRVTDTDVVHFRVNLTSAASGKQIIATYTATPIEPYPADGKSITATKTFN
ncbi:hypothetical protein ACFQRL_00910 [Microbacterium fluvii]|uniref:Tat pathway signal sequence domain protein n=1 Tax=Microbacterium fluvii TaxID=415215 RepID=A0ABW2H8U3_9MICO|nr:hypothetical protein [Microbacterium fluvii]MCU4671146.1 hypothetical protein [Microbacterium fluvii]